MPKRPSPEKLIQLLISETLRSYMTAVKNRRKVLELSRMSFKVEKWQEKAPPLSKLTVTYSRVCDSMSRELLNLYTIEERLRQKSDASLHIVIEHVDSPWNKPNNAEEEKTIWQA